MLTYATLTTGITKQNSSFLRRYSEETCSELSLVIAVKLKQKHAGYIKSGDA